MKEAELAQKFVEYLKDSYELYFEMYGVDILGRTDNHTIGVEVKTSFNFKVIEQAVINSRGLVNYSYVAIPEPKVRSFAFDICKTYGIGVLLYNQQHNSVYMRQPAKLNRNPVPSSLKWDDIYKKAIPGTKTGETGIKSAFKLTVEEIERNIERHPRITIKELVELRGRFHWSNINSAKSCIYNYIRNGVIKTIKLEDGKLYLKETA